MNNHNLIHLADDVKNFKLTLTDISAFWAESYNGRLKKLVRTPKNPLAQVLKRIAEKDTLASVKMRPRKEIGNIIFKNKEIKTIYTRNAIMSHKFPNNIVLLKSGNIMIIRNIIPSNRNVNVRKLLNFNITGCIVTKIQDTFFIPDDSSKFGVYKILEISDENITLPISDVEAKCIQFQIDNNLYAITLLHNSNIEETNA